MGATKITYLKASEVKIDNNKKGIRYFNCGTEKWEPFDLEKNNLIIFDEPELSIDKNRMLSVNVDLISPYFYYDYTLTPKIETIKNNYTVDLLRITFHTTVPLAELNKAQNIKLNLEVENDFREYKTCLYWDFVYNEFVFSDSLISNALLKKCAKKTQKNYEDRLFFTALDIKKNKHRNLKIGEKTYKIDFDYKTKYLDMNTSFQLRDLSFNVRDNISSARLFSISKDLMTNDWFVWKRANQSESVKEIEDYIFKHLDFVDYLFTNQIKDNVNLD